MSDRIYERMCKFYWDRFTVRTWIKTPSIRDTAYLETVRKLEELFETPAPPEVELAVMELANGFKEELAAVEVVDTSGNGVVIYTEWP